MRKFATLALAVALGGGLAVVQAPAANAANAAIYRPGTGSQSIGIPTTPTYRAPWHRLVRPWHPWAPHCPTVCATRR